MGSDRCVPTARCRRERTRELIPRRLAVPISRGHLIQGLFDAKELRKKLSHSACFERRSISMDIEQIGHTFCILRALQKLIDQLRSLGRRYVVKKLAHIGARWNLTVRSRETRRKNSASSERAPSSPPAAAEIIASMRSCSVSPPVAWLDQATRYQPDPSKIRQTVRAELPHVTKHLR